MNRQGAEHLLQTGCWRNTLLVTGLLSGMLAPLAIALPEDASQPIDVYGEQGEVILDLGISTIYGTAEDPARVTQGSMVVSGLELIVQRGEEGELLKVSASGSPARFQQQPAADKPIVYARGLTLTFDNVASLVTVDEDAEFTQGGTVITGHQIVYNLDSRRVNFTRSPDEQFRITIPPQPQENP